MWGKLSSTEVQPQLREQGAYRSQCVPDSHTLLSWVGRKSLSEFCAVLGTQLLFLLSLGLVFNIMYDASVSMLVMLNSYNLS